MATVLRKRAFQAGLVAAAWVFVVAPGLARACSVCTAGRDEENQAAFIATTVFMSVLPLAVIGTIVFLLRRRYKKLIAQSQRRPARSAGLEIAVER